MDLPPGTTIKHEDAVSLIKQENEHSICIKEEFFEESKMNVASQAATGSVSIYYCPILSFF